MASVPSCRKLLAQQPFVPLPPPTTQWQGQSQGGATVTRAGYGGAGTMGGMGASLFVPGPQGGSGNWWPAELGYASGSGAQNNIRYAYFSNTRRLAVDINGQVTVYDTLDNQIGGVSQQQGGWLAHIHQPVRHHTRREPARRLHQRRAPERPGTEPWQPEPPFPSRQPQPDPPDRDGPGNGHLRQDRAARRLAAEGDPFPGRVLCQEGRASGTALTAILLSSL